MKKFFFLFVLVSMVTFSSGAQTGKDVDGDGTIDLTDVSLLINFIICLSSDAGSFDITGDGVVDMSDVSMLVDYVLNPPKPLANETFTVNGVSFDMILVEGGTFRMGATEEQGSDVMSDEKPVHEVSVSSYLIGKTEVTTELWKAVLGWNPSDFRGTNLPVECVAWSNCQSFISELNKLTGRKFRLPTEAEWEFAARGGNKSKGYKYSGSNSIDEVAWYSGNSNSRTQPVGTKQPNELGIYDMTGNVSEWCSDYYSSSYYSESPVLNPTGPESGTTRSKRGGNWMNSESFCRVSRRGEYSPGDINYNLGLRLCLSE